MAADHPDMNSGDAIVEDVPMPDGLIALVQGFLDAHRLDEGGPKFCSRNQRLAATFARSED